jgi:ABC-type antimicrobial peptide transport system permease subunit
MYFVARPQVTPFEERGIIAFETRSLYVNDIVLRTNARDPMRETHIRQAFAEVDPNLTVMRIQTFDTQLANNVNQQQLIARLASVFGVIALLLASIGLYGVTSYTVQRRSKEIGIRVALGAGRPTVLSLVIRGVCTLVAIGLAIGIPLSLAMGRVLSTKLYGISPHDPVTLAGAVALLAVFALAAVIVPARRAASIDPVITLRLD